MTSMLVPWAATLAHADSMHIMPFLAAALTFASSMIPLTSEMSLQASTRQKLGISIFASIDLYLYDVAFADCSWTLLGDKLAICTAGTMVLSNGYGEKVTFTLK